MALAEFPVRKRIEMVLSAAMRASGHICLASEAQVLEIAEHDLMAQLRVNDPL
jgi:hypothetical protein